MVWQLKISNCVFIFDIIDLYDEMKGVVGSNRYQVAQNRSQWLSLKEEEEYFVYLTVKKYQFQGSKNIENK